MPSLPPTQLQYKPGSTPPFNFSTVNTPMPLLHLTNKTSPPLAQNDAAQTLPNANTNDVALSLILPRPHRHPSFHQHHHTNSPHITSHQRGTPCLLFTNFTHRPSLQRTLSTDHTHCPNPNHSATKHNTAAKPPQNHTRNHQKTVLKTVLNHLNN